MPAMSSCLSSLPALLAAVAMFGFAAAPALAEQRTDYAVTIAGSLDYNRADADGGAALQHDEAVDFRTQIPRLSFSGRVAEPTAPALGTASITRSSFTMTGEQRLAPTFCRQTMCVFVTSPLPPGRIAHTLRPSEPEFMT